MRRTFWLSKEPLTGASANHSDDNADRYIVADEDEANLVGSLLGNGMHAPAIDIDLPCELIESSTPGHFHLYIDHELTWEQYKLLLAVLADVGIVEPGYYRASVARGQTFLRKPGVTK